MFLRVAPNTTRWPFSSHCLQSHLDAGETRPGHSHVDYINARQAADACFFIPVD